MQQKVNDIEYAANAAVCESSQYFAAAISSLLPQQIQTPQLPPTSQQQQQQQVKHPFPQIDVIGAMVIVWRVRRKIIMSVLCNIVRNSYAHCSAHT